MPDCDVHRGLLSGQPVCDQKDHIHMLVSIPPKMSVSSFMGYLKGKSALMMFDRHANLKYKYGNRHFWSEGYYVSTVGLNSENRANSRKFVYSDCKRSWI